MRIVLNLFCLYTKYIHQRFRLFVFQCTLNLSHDTHPIENKIYFRFEQVDWLFFSFYNVNELEYDD